MSDGLWLIVAGVVLLDVLVAWRVVIEWRRYRVRRAMHRIEANFREAQRVIGEALLPVLRDVAVAFAAFASAFDRPTKGTPEHE